jgi:hypothetical protein
VNVPVKSPLVRVCEILTVYVPTPPAVPVNCAEIVVPEVTLFPVNT